ncbi:MAG: hypothetical protein II942_05385 [Alphaproteobacteria bacterium]|nr:hypothetical protein [Alphaproteobacteria bacterium]
MKKIIVLVMALCLSCSAMAKGAACPKAQWLNGKKCAACPANATCNGNVFKCNKNFGQVGLKCIQTNCGKGLWMNGSKCAACPANASCKDGRTFQCNKNFAQKGSTCIPTTCSKGQWLNGNQCAICPANATCKDGKTFVCNKNYVQKGNGCVYQNDVAANCEKYGSHTSHEWIEARQKDCVDCGLTVGSDSRIVYYCYCGKGCAVAKGLSSDVGGKNGMKEKIKGCIKKTAKSKTTAAVAAVAVPASVLTGGVSVMASTEVYKLKFAECITKDIVNKLKDKLKKAIKKIF